MEKVHFFFPSKAYIQAIRKLFKTHQKRIINLIPTARIEHIGGTAIPNLMTKGDLDLQVSVSADNFDRAVTLLQTEYQNHQLENWNESYASFNDRQDSVIPVGIQLVIQGSESDFFVKSRDFLLANLEHVKELNRLKQLHSGGDMDVYIQHKGEFFTALLKRAR